MVYRPKAPAAKAEETVAKAEQVEEQKVAQTPQGGDQPQPPAKAKKESNPKPRRDRKEPAKTEESKTEAAKPKKEHAVAAAAETVPSTPVAESHKSAPAKDKDSKHAPKVEHKEPKEQKDHHNTSKEVASLQSQLLAKEHDVGRLQKQLARQEKKTDEANQENHQLKEQLKLSSDEN